VPRQKIQTKKPKLLAGFHWHHIVPTHAGGNNMPDNLILLSPIDHAIAHYVLYKLHKKEADAWAYNRLLRQANHKTSSLTCKPNLNRKFSDEVNKKKGKSGNDNAMSRPEIKIKHKDAMIKLRGSETVKNYGTSNPSSKKLRINGVNFDCIALAAKTLGLSRCTVRGWLDGSRKPQSRYKIWEITNTGGGGGNQKRRAAIGTT
jgi:hypothetical protein